MQKENNLTVGQWCDHWFTANRHKWNSNTEGGYRNLIYSHIIPSIGSVALSDLTKQTITDFYDSLRCQGLSARSVWCVHLLLRRCLDEAAREQFIPYNPVRLCQESKAEGYKAAPLRLGQLQRYLNAAEQLGVLPLIYTGLSSGLRQCELITLSWADFHVRYGYILKGQRLLTLNEKVAYLYLSDDVEVRNIRLGLNWIYTTAVNGSSCAMYRLAKECLKGEHIKKNTASALEWFTRSAEGGNPYAQYMLGKLYLAGREVLHDEDRGVYWLTKSAEQDNQYAQYLLNHLEENRPPSAMLAVTRLLHHMSRVFRDNSVPKSRPGGIQIDRKRLKKLQEKRMALGHKPDDHEEQWPDMTM